MDPTQKRRLAERGLIALGALLGALILTLVAIQLGENRSNVLESVRYDAMKQAIAADPANEELIGEFRVFDQQLRAQYFQNRRRFQWAGFLVIFGLIGLIALARWRMALGPQPVIDPLAPRTQENRAHGQVATLVVGGSAFLALLIMALWLQPRLPFLEKQVVEAPPEVEPAQTWAMFRGPDNLGIARDGDWPTTWSVANDVNILWKTPIPYPGNSSPVVWGDTIFLTAGDDKEHIFLCVDRPTGAIRWTRTIDSPPLPDDYYVMEDTGYAAPTPVTDGRRVYGVFASGLVAAFDFNGNMVWVRELGLPESMYGYAASPIMFEDVLIIQYDVGYDPEDSRSVMIGLDGRTGQDRWRTPRPAPNTWSSPAIIRTDERVKVVAAGKPFTIAYNPINGAELWRARGLDGDVAPSPTFGGGLIFVVQDMSYMLAIRPGGSGDVTETHVVWQFDDGLPDTSSPVTDGRHVIQVGGGGLLTCVNVSGPDLRWETYLDSAATASPILVGDLVYLPCEDGLTRIFKIDADAYTLVDQGDVGEPIHATPAFVEGHIILRGATHLYCIGEQP